MSGSPKRGSSGSRGSQYRRVCKNKSLITLRDGDNAGECGMGENARIWSLWRQACFPPGAFRGTIGNRNLVGLQGETGWDYHIYEV